MKATKTYQQAMDELDAIVSQIENDELSIVTTLFQNKKSFRTHYFLQRQIAKNR